MPARGFRHAANAPSGPVPADARPPPAEARRYDREQVEAVLDAGLVAHLGFEHDGQPYVIPTLHARVGDQVYVHGSAASRTLRELAAGIPPASR